MSNETLIDTCPKCGERELRAGVDMPAYFAITNSLYPISGTKPLRYKPSQSLVFDRVTSDDPESEPFEIKCDSCGAYWEGNQFRLNNEGFLVWFGVATGDDE